MATPTMTLSNPINRVPSAYSIAGNKVCASMYVTMMNPIQAIVRSIIIVRVFLSSDILIHLMKRMLVKTARKAEYNERMEIDLTKISSLTFTFAESILTSVKGAFGSGLAVIHPSSTHGEYYMHLVHYMWQESDDRDDLYSPDYGGGRHYRSYE